MITVGKGFDWDELMKKEDSFYGRDAELLEDGRVFRGPICGIRMVDNLFSILTSWCATFESDTWVFESHVPREVAEVRTSMTNPIRKEDGSVVISIPYIGVLRILKRGDKLDHSNVCNRD